MLWAFDSDSSTRLAIDMMLTNSYRLCHVDDELNCHVRVNKQQKFCEDFNVSICIWWITLIWVERTAVSFYYYSKIQK